MSTSVIHSARRSTASAFDFVATTANAANDLVGTAAKAIDTLSVKVDYMHAQVVTETKLAKVGMINLTLNKSASDYVDAMEEIHRRNFPDEAFDRKAHLKAILSEMTAALEAN